MNIFTIYYLKKKNSIYLTNQKQSYSIQILIHWLCILNFPAQRATSWLPSMSVMEVVERENGQRRVPVPAWGIKR